MWLPLQSWIKVSLWNLLLVATLGVILRYKIAFSLLFIDQKHLLHGHSHFAFAGWITQALMSLLVGYLAKEKGLQVFTRYRFLLYANLLSAYGMLLSFPFQGYGSISISFSTLSVFVSYVFAVMYWKDLNRISKKNSNQSWFKAAVLFNAVSSLGAFGLAFMMAKHVTNQNWYLAAVYFFLHFQYNGWFFFACMGLLINGLPVGITELKYFKIIFRLFFFACVPAYFLSVLWMPIPLWLYILVIVSAIMQVAGLIVLIRVIKSNFPFIKNAITKPASYLLGLSALALSVKLLLQLGSVIPSLSQLAFGFHPIVIGYLHLVLLGVITLFILGYAVNYGLINTNKLAVTGIIIFTTGVILNEVVLMSQGVEAILYKIIPYCNEVLLGVAVIMFSGLLLVNIGIHYTTR